MVSFVNNHYRVGHYSNIIYNNYFNETDMLVLIIQIKVYY